jgi:hypothetical protein
VKNLWWVAFIGLLLSFFLLSFVPQGKGEEQSESKTTSGSLVETIIALKEQVPVLKTVYLSPLTIRKIFGHFLYCFLIAFVPVIRRGKIFPRSEMKRLKRSASFQSILVILLSVK